MTFITNRGKGLPVVYGPGRAVARKVPSSVPCYVLEALEPRVLMTAAPGGLPTPTPLYESFPFVVATKYGVVVSVAMSDGWGSYLTRFTDDGQIDRSFGNEGALVLAEHGELDSLEARSDGGLVLLMQDYDAGDVSVIELDAQGNLDRTFGTAGSLKLPIRALTGAGMTLMSDGRVVVAEPVAPEPFPDPYGPADAIGLYRFTASGEPDRTFGEGGFEQLSVPSGMCFIQSISAGPAGEVSLLAMPWDNDSGVWLMKTDATGAPKMDLGEAGVVTLDIPVWPYCYMLSDGKLVMVENDDLGGLRVRQFTSDGEADQSFGNQQGWVKWGEDPSLYSVGSTLRLPDGTLVVTYTSLTTFSTDPDHLLAFNADGSPSTTFGQGAGGVAVPRPGDDWRAMDDSAAVVDKAGRIVNVCYLRQGHEGAWGEWSLAISRFNADGTLDTTFAGTGSVFMKTEVMNGAPPSPPAVAPESLEVPVAKEPDPPIEGSVETDIVVPNVSHSLDSIDDSMALLGVKSKDDFLGRLSDDLYAA